MRLINTRTRELKDHIDGSVPKYAILSHTWGPDEVTFDDYHNSQLAQSKAGFSKIEYACWQGLQDGLDYVWIDTCCINKSSSAELSEAINSMFRWYQESEICYAFLEDLELDTSLTSSQEPMQTVEGLLRSCKWFTRGWTLQEMIAPANLVLFAQGWTYLGTKNDLKHALSLITGVDEVILCGRSCLTASVARRMSWAAKRRTTRVEDIAYCLMGIFDVNMPLLYGEGHKAFMRLQEEILKVNDDQTILAWGEGLQEDQGRYQKLVRNTEAHGMLKWLRLMANEGGMPYDVLAKSPKPFADSGNYVPHGVADGQLSINSRGVNAQLRDAEPWIARAATFLKHNMKADLETYFRPPTFVFALNCRHQKHPGTQIAIVVLKTRTNNYVRFAMFLQEVHKDHVAKTLTSVLLEKLDRSSNSPYYSALCTTENSPDNVVVTLEMPRFRLTRVYGGEFDHSNNQVLFNNSGAVKLLCTDTQSKTNFFVFVVHYHRYGHGVWMSKSLNSEPREVTNPTKDTLIFFPSDPEADGLFVQASMMTDEVMGPMHYYLKLNGTDFRSPKVRTALLRQNFHLARRLFWEKLDAFFTKIFFLAIHPPSGTSFDFTELGVFERSAAEASSLDQHQLQLP